MRSKRIYIVWHRISGNGWKAFYGGLELWIFQYDDGACLFGENVLPVNCRHLYPSLNLAKRAGSKWLRKKAGEKATKAKPGGGRKR